jgi:nucleoside-diphosphate-sugar epimerase
MEPPRPQGLRVFVTGATGVIGRRVVPLLLTQGHAVTALARSPEARARLDQAGAACATADLFDATALTRAVAGHDAIVNLATHMPNAAWKMAFRSAWRQNDRLRTEGVANLVAAALAAGVPRLLQESFSLTYPDRGDAWIDEGTTLEPAAYNRTVLDAEQSVARFTASGGTGVALRFAAFYGPDAMQVRSYIAGLRKGFALLPGGPERYISSVSHDDAGAAVVAALMAPAGAYNVVDDEPVRRAEFFGSLAAALHAKPPRFLPAWAAPLFGAVGPTMARSLRISNRKLKDATGWAPRFPSVREAWPEVLFNIDH